MGSAVAEPLHATSSSQRASAHLLRTLGTPGAVRRGGVLELERPRTFDRLKSLPFPVARLLLRGYGLQTGELVGWPAGRLVGRLMPG